MPVDGDGGLGEWGDAAGGADGSAGGGGAVAFTYTPGWAGVTSVGVIGGFGTTSDWSVKAPFLALAKDATGTFRGTAQLAPGQYPFLFHVVGDADFGPNASKLAVDPSTPVAVPCPMASPTYNPKVENPCSQLSVPQATGPMFHVTGTVRKDGAPAAGYFVTIERHELTQHHGFVNRATTGADGRFDLDVVQGEYHVSVAHPTTATETDSMRDPIALAAYKSLTSAQFAVAADTALDVPDVALHSYATYAPTPTAALPTPTHFTFTSGVPSRLDFFLSNAAGTSTAGDPVYTSPETTAGAVDFAGAYAGAAGTGTVAAGTRYFWGTQTATMTDAGSVGWKASSMVFPIQWK